MSRATITTYSKYENIHTICLNLIGYLSNKHNQNEQNISKVNGLEPMEEPLSQFLDFLLCTLVNYSSINFDDKLEEIKIYKNIIKLKSLFLKKDLNPIQNNLEIQNNLDLIFDNIIGDNYDKNKNVVNVRYIEKFKKIVKMVILEYLLTTCKDESTLGAIEEIMESLHHLLRFTKEDESPEGCYNSFDTKEYLKLLKNVTQDHFEPESGNILGENHLDHMEQIGFNNEGDLSGNDFNEYFE